MSFDLGNYTTVNDRLLELFTKHPDARIVNSVPKIVVFDDRSSRNVDQIVLGDIVAG